jgi:hypothetical protein
MKDYSAYKDDAEESSCIRAALTSNRFAAALEHAMDRNMERSSSKNSGSASWPKPQVVRQPADVHRLWNPPMMQVAPASAAAEAQEVSRFNFWMPRSSDDVPLPSARGDVGVPAQDTTERSERRQLLHLEIPEEDVKDFRTFAKELAAHLRVECAATNPYVKALVTHRVEMGLNGMDLQSDEKPQSLAMKLATQRHDALASLDVDAPSSSHGKEEVVDDVNVDRWFDLWPPMCVMEAERNGLACADATSQGDVFSRRHPAGEFSVADASSHNTGGRLERRPCCKELTEEFGHPCDPDAVSQPAELLEFGGAPSYTLDSCTSGHSLAVRSAQGSLVPPKSGQAERQTRM